MMSSCRAGRNAKTTLPQNTDTVNVINTTKDTVVIMHEDAAAYPKKVLMNLYNSNLDYKTFNAKIKLQYEDTLQSFSATEYIHLAKDSLIWISIRGPLNFDVARMLITRDSVKIINNFEKSYQLMGFDYLQQLTGLPLDFAAVQNIITGQPFFVDSILTRFGYEGNYMSLVTESNGLLKTTTVDTAASDAIKYFNAEQNIFPFYSFHIAYSDYENDGYTNFSMYRDIEINAERKITISLDFKETGWNQPLDYLFKIPENYKRR